MRLYLDAMVWIYAFEGRSTLSGLAKELFAKIEFSQHTILASHFLMAELLVVPTRNHDQFTMARYRRLLAPSPTLEIIAFEANVASRFAELRAAHRVKQPDAIHLGLAASANAEWVRYGGRSLEQADRPRHWDDRRSDLSAAVVVGASFTEA